MTDNPNSATPPRGLPLALDPSAESTSPTEPAFLASPPGAPPYHGFQILHDVVVEGFTLGMITNFEAEECTYGDAFVIAPDNSRAGIVWEISQVPSFSQVCAPEPNRWGAWAVGFPHPMTSRENARKNLRSVLPELKERWLAWCPLG